LLPTSKAENYELEISLVQNGIPIVLSLYSSVLRNDKFEATGILCYIRDITEKKRNEMLLQESEQKNKDLILAIPDLMFVINKEGIFEDFKFDGESILAVRKDSIIGLHLSEVFDGETLRKVEEKIAKVLSNGFMEKLKYQMDTAKGLLWFEARITNLGSDKVLVLLRELNGDEER